MYMNMRLSTNTKRSLSISNEILPSIQFKCIRHCKVNSFITIFGLAIIILIFSMNFILGPKDIVQNFSHKFVINNHFQWIKDKNWFYRQFSRYCDERQKIERARAHIRIHTNEIRIDWMILNQILMTNR